ncbi:hypothetical protein [Clostridium sp. DL-VIII]|nr:hypothetical protein [Clostridium sp. DL-VIII]
MRKITLDKDELLNNNKLKGLNAVETWKILHENLKAMNIQR